MLPNRVLINLIFKSERIHLGTQKIGENRLPWMSCSAWAVYYCRSLRVMDLSSALMGLAQGLWCQSTVIRSQPEAMVFKLAVICK